MWWAAVYTTPGTERHGLELEKEAEENQKCHFTQNHCMQPLFFFKSSSEKRILLELNLGMAKYEPEPKKEKTLGRSKWKGSTK